MTSGPAWTLKNFDESLDRWQKVSNPSPDLCVIVADWLMTRLIDPYHKATLDPVSDRWFARSQILMTGAATWSPARTGLTRPLAP